MTTVEMQKERLDPGWMGSPAASILVGRNKPTAMIIAAG
jgi:hypothetical protein